MPAYYSVYSIARSTADGFVLEMMQRGERAETAGNAGRLASVSPGCRRAGSISRRPALACGWPRRGWLFPARSPAPLSALSRTPGRLACTRSSVATRPLLPVYTCRAAFGRATIQCLCLISGVLGEKIGNAGRVR